VKPFFRADRVAGHIQRALSAILLKEAGDPRIGTATITRVTVSRDLRMARVYFTVHADEDERRQAAVDGFRNARAYLKRCLAPELALRYMPELEFFYDDSFDHAARINRILKSLHQENAADHPPVETE
jgi:ribosome-binding factor A